jgi:hypothetical protein
VSVVVSHHISVTTEPECVGEQVKIGDDDGWP